MKRRMGEGKMKRGIGGGNGEERNSKKKNGIMAHKGRGRDEMRSKGYF